MELLLLLLSAFVAGLIDAVVGGGLVQILLLFAAFPETAPATIFGTNKLSAVFGTGSAALPYLRRVEVPWRAALPAASAAFCSVFVGAIAVSALAPPMLKPLALVLLIVVAGYTWARKDFGQVDVRLQLGRRHMLGELGVGCEIGFYDGFFGSGTGSFLIFCSFGFWS